MKHLFTLLYIILGTLQLSFAQPVITDLTLVNSDFDTDMRDLSLTEDTLYMDENLTIRAKVSGIVESVRFYINGVLKLNENNPPYGLTGNTSGDFDEWLKTPGLFKISAVPFSGNNGSGIKGDTVSRYVRIIFPNDTTDNIQFVLVDASYDVDIRSLHDEDTIYVASGDKITIKAKPVYAKSVEFIMNGSSYRVENSSPYSLQGNVSGNYYPWPYAPGHYELVVKVYSGYTALGTMIQIDTLRFVILENVGLSVSGFPNPLDNNSSLLITVHEDQDVQITLLDNIGKIYFQRDMVISSGQNSIPINANDYQLATGIYFAKIRGEKDEKIIKFYKE